MRLRSHLAPVADVLVPWGTGVLLALIAIDAHSSPGWVSLGVALAVIQGAALHWRRGRPELVMAVTLVAATAFFALAPDTVIPFAPLFAVHSLAATRPPRVSLPGLVGLEALCALNFLTTSVGDTTFTMALAVGAWALGEAARNRRVAIARGGAARGRRGAGADRARAARRDRAQRVGDGRAGRGRRRRLRRAPRPGARRRCARSSTPGREALAEMRRLLGAVQPGDGETDAARSRASPARRLVEPLRAGGLDVVGPPRGRRRRRCRAGVDLSAYRIVQEALTNTLRHARATRAEVDGALRGRRASSSRSRDDGRAAPATGGRRPRARRHARARGAATAGRSRPGRAPERRLRVHARLPLRGARVTIRVLIADDQALVRGGFRMILDAQDGHRGGRRGRRRRARRSRWPSAQRPTWC